MNWVFRALTVAFLVAAIHFNVTGAVYVISTWFWFIAVATMVGVISAVAGTDVFIQAEQVRGNRMNIARAFRFFYLGVFVWNAWIATAIACVIAWLGFEFLMQLAVERKT